MEERQWGAVHCGACRPPLGQTTVSSHCANSCAPSRHERREPPQRAAICSAIRRRRNALPQGLAIVLLVLLFCLAQGEAFSLSFGIGRPRDRASDIPSQCDLTLADRSCSDGGRSVYSCIQCLPGEWCHGINDTVTQQDGGEDGLGNTTYQFVCEPCPAGCFQSSPGQHYCLTCHAGNYSASCNQTSCDHCQPGHHSANDDRPHITCTKCAPGRNQTHYGNDTCYKCPGSFICNRTGCVDCDRCHLGAEANANRTSCQLCSPGKYNAGYQEKCTACEPGKFCNATGCHQCQGCHPGTFAAHPGASHCILCQRGHAQSLPGQFACPKCKQGHYASKMGSTECIECGVGYYCPNAESEPQPCPASAYCPKGSEAPQYCQAMFDLNGNADGCSMSGGLIGVIAATILVNVIIVTLLAWYYYRKKKLYTGESQPLVWRKETMSRDPPVYDGF